MPATASRAGSRPALGARVADHLLAATHVGFAVEHVAVAWDAPLTECVAVGREVAARAATPAEADAEGARQRSVFAPALDAKTPPFAAGDDAEAFAPHGDAQARPTTLLVVADGSARRTEKAPGHLDPRSHEVDAAIVASIRGAADGGLAALLDLDPDLCADLLVAGRAPLQVLAAAAGATNPLEPRDL